MMYNSSSRKMWACSSGPSSSKYKKIVVYYLSTWSSTFLKSLLHTILEWWCPLWSIVATAPSMYHTSATYLQETWFDPPSFRIINCPASFSDLTKIQFLSCSWAANQISWKISHNTPLFIHFCLYFVIFVVTKVGGKLFCLARRENLLDTLIEYQ